MIEGVAHTIQMQASASGKDTLRCGHIRLRDPSGEIVAVDDPDRCLVTEDAEIDFVPTETGSYLMKARRASGARTDRGRYALQVAPSRDSPPASRSASSCWASAHAASCTRRLLVLAAFGPLRSDPSALGPGRPYLAGSHVGSDPNGVG